MARHLWRQLRNVFTFLYLTAVLVSGLIPCKTFCLGLLILVGTVAATHLFLNLLRSLGTGKTFGAE